MGGNILKRIMSCVLVLTLILSLAACGGSVPEGLSQKTYTIGKKALGTMDKYLSDKISGETAEKQIREQYDELKEESERLQQQRDSNPADEITYEHCINASYVGFWITEFALGIFGDGDCQEARDNLYGILHKDS